MCKKPCDSVFEQTKITAVGRIEKEASGKPLTISIVMLQLLPSSADIVKFRWNAF